MLFRYGLVSVLTIAGLVWLKIWLFPYLLWRTLSASDAGAIVYEMLILILGALTFIVYVALGHLGKYHFYLSRGQHLLATLLIQAPFFLHGWLKIQHIDPKKVTALYQFAEGWCSLLAEPIRLLFFVYPWTDIIAVFLSFFLVLVGRAIEKGTDEIYHLGGEHNKLEGGR
ncbi:hypothetical protein [Aneurinibacillus tyrosinisolvens]|uniref:hypothetical protein n=1 Tax=Aneurinibacillus tyrosinisolvens TaxID=1443435 RepID=UPI00063F6744|nr:hypothetical protein [Aneurinibacillus tyrosinisolvens]